MGLRINTNVSSIGALRNLQRADSMQQGSLERLSTGLRINRASDDPAGLVISEKLRAQIRGMEQAAENSQNASNLIGTAEAALDEVMRSLSCLSTYTASRRRCDAMSQATDAERQRLVDDADVRFVFDDLPHGETSPADVAGATIDAVVTVIDTRIGEQHLEQRNAASVGSVAVADAGPACGTQGLGTS